MSYNTLHVRYQILHVSALMCWTYDPLQLLNSLKMAPWCRNM